MKKTFAYLYSKAFCVASEFLFGKTLYTLGGAKDVVFDKKIRYCGDENLYLNVCRQKNQSEKLPLFIYLHGGGFVSGAPDYRKAIISNIAADGYVVVGIFYGLAPKYVFPAPVENIYKALAFLKTNAGKYNFDDGKIYVAGESAGASLAVTLGAISSNDKMKNFFNLDPGSKDTAFSGIGAICGLYDTHSALNSGYPYMKEYLCSYADKDVDGLLNDEDAQYMSPIRFINSSFPKTFVITGERDALREDGFRLSEKLQAVNVENGAFHGVGGTAIHAFPVGQALPVAKTALGEMLKFFK
ncbi:MAG: alpha/beta hydrolase [Clostridiales bacterium]|jgi:acetyl esterase/lipase|nr:alpha/beta hydrolase [Clostridiales bacterium]